MRTTILFLSIIAGLTFSQKSSAQSRNDSCNISATFLYVDTSACQIAFQPLTFGSNNNYYWDFGDGNTANNAFPYHEYNSSGTYNVILTVSNDTCIETFTQIVTVPPCNEPCNLNPVFTYYDTLDCNTAFYPGNFNPNHSYTWDFGDGNTANNAFPYHEYNSSGTYNVILTVSNDTCIETFTQIVTVPPCNEPCDLNPVFTYYDSACYTGFVPNQLDSSLTYMWDFDDGNTATGYTPEHLYDTTGTYYVTLFVTNGTCTDSIQKTVYATACNPCPIDASFTAVENGLNTYDFSPGNYDSNLNYHWIFGDGTTSTNANTSHTYQNEDDYFVTLVVSNCSCSVSETISISINDSTACNYDGEFTFTLENDGSYTFTPVYQSSNYNYYWEFGDGSSSTNMYPNYIYLLDSNYTVSLNIWESNNSFCSDTTYQDIPVSNTPNCAINSSFSYNSDTNNVVFNFQPDVYNSNYDYYWDFGDGQTSNFHSPNHTYATNGIYVVHLTVYLDSCQSNDSTHIQLFMASLNDIPNSQSEIKIFPNPTSDYLNIDFKSINSERIMITLVDVTGKLIKQDAFNLNEGENHKKINVQSMSQGVYQIFIREENGTILQKSRFIKN